MKSVVMIHRIIHHILESNFQSSGIMRMEQQVSSDGSYTYDEVSELSEDATTTEIRNIDKNENISPETRAHLYAAKIVQNRIPLFEQENQDLRENLHKNNCKNNLRELLLMVIFL